MKKYFEIKRIVSLFLITVFCLYNTSLAALAVETEITKFDGIDTGTLITPSEENKHIFDISTNTTVKDIGINAFNRFNVGEGDTVNLHLINNQTKLVNLIFDNSASQINGIVNSYIGNEIGGNVLFANPNGFVIGSNGVFNVGALTLMTPTEDTMRELIENESKNTWNQANVEKLLSFSFNDSDYLITGNAYYPYELAQGDIEVAGKINSKQGIDLISGSKVNILKDAVLNANMNFVTAGNTITATPDDKFTGGDTNYVGEAGESYPKNLAMQDGNNIVIVASNTGGSNDKLSAIVNLDGKINANNGDVFVKTEVFQTDKAGDAKSQINVNSTSNINGNNVLINAVSLVTSTDKNIIGVTDLAEEDFYGYLAAIPEFFVDEFVHLAEIDTSVNVESGAVINAADNLILGSLSDITLSTEFLSSVLPYVNFNITKVGSNTKTIVKNNAALSANNLNVNATTDLSLLTSTKTTNLPDHIDDVQALRIGSYALGITLADITNSAVIENGADLNVNDNLTVEANTISEQIDVVKNGLIPIVDKNRGAVGAAASFIITNVDNSAVMNADADIAGKLSVLADYTGNVTSTVAGYSGGEGESGEYGAVGNIVINLFKHFQSVDAVNSVITRTNAKFDNIDVAAAIGIIVDEVNSSAQIGSINENIKPEITAGQVDVTSNLTDNKSTLYVQAESENGKTAASGAFAVNYKDLNSNANAYGDFNLNGANNIVYLDVPNNTASGKFYENSSNKTIITEEDYNKLKDEDKSKYTSIKDDVFWYYDENSNITYTTDKSKKVNFEKSKDIVYTNGETLIAQTYYDKLSESEKQAFQLAKGDVYYYINGGKQNALNIVSNTEIIHPMAWLDWFPELMEFFSSSNWNEAFGEVKNKWSSTEKNNVTDYLSSLGSISELSNLIDSDSFSIINAVDFSNVGAYGFFNTFAQSKANAKQQLGETKAMSGAIGLALFNTDSNAILENNSSVTLRGQEKVSGINIEAYGKNEVWTAATLMDIMTLIDGLPLSGASARDGSAYGAGVAASYSDSNIIAKVGDNVSIKKDNTAANAGEGDLNVTAKEDGNFLTLSIGSSSPDEAGLAGCIGMTVLGSGLVSATIGSSADNYSIEAKNVNVEASKDDNFVNAIIAFANGEKSYGFGISGIILTDAVKSAIAGKINAVESVNVNASYDKLLVNANANVGVAKKGTDAPQVVPSSDAADDFLDMNLLFAGESWINDTDPNAEKLKTKWDNFKNNWKNVSEKIDTLDQYKDLVNNGYERAVNPQKETAAYAGGINLNTITNRVSASIADGADITAGKDVTVEAVSKDQTINTNAVVAANGTSGGGATLMVDVTSNTVDAAIGNASVNANNAITVNAKESYSLIAASAGVAQEKDSAGAGNVSTAVQVNNVTAAIKDGARINTDTKNDSAESSVSVKAETDSNVIKAVGALSIQSGSETGNSTGSKGGTLDGDVVVNSVNAYISGANVNALNNIDVTANNNDNFIVVDVAGSVSTQSAAYGGTVGAYVAVNDVSAYIKDSQINQKKFSLPQENQNVNIKASSYFNEVAVVGTVAGGNKTGAGGSVRTDIIANNVKSYIQNSAVTANKTIRLENTDKMQQISVTVAGSGSTNANAGSGVLSVLVDATDQDNYIDNSTVTANSLVLDTDKVLETISVAGAIAAAAQGTSVGASVYILGAQHDIDTYIKNSDITASENIDLTSDFRQDLLSIIFGGAGGQNVTVTGAVSAVINNSNINTYVIADEGSKKNKLQSTGGAITVKSKNDIDTITIDGNVGVSTGGSGVSAGGAMNVTVYDSDITAGVQGVDIIVQNGINVEASADQKHTSTVAGGSGGNGVSVQGSVDTLIMAQDIDAYIKDSVIKSGGNITVLSDDVLELMSVLGAVAVSTGSGSVGGSILTVTMTGNNKAHIDNTTIDKYNNSELGNLLVKATQSDSFKGGSVAGSVGTFAVTGTIGTVVINKDINAYTDGLKNINNSNFSNVEVNASGNTIYGHGTGQISAGTSGAGVGGAISTLVLNKNINAEIKNSVLNSSGYIKNLSNADIDILSIALGFGGASSVAVNGSVVTQVLNVDTKSLVENSSISAIGAVVNNSVNDTALKMNVTTANGAGTAAIGGVVYSLVDNSTANASINSNSNIISAKTLDNTANMVSAYIVTLFNASGAGNAAVNGTVSTLVLNSAANALIDNSTISNTGDITNTTSNRADTNVIIGQASGAGSAAVNSGINTFVSSKKSKAEITNTEVSSTGNINIAANANNDIETTVMGGAGAGEAAVTGSINTIVSSDEIKAGIYNSKVNTTVANSSTKDSGISVTADDTLNVVGRTGAVSGAGGAAVGGSIITGVITNKAVAELSNSDVTAANSDIIINSKANETIGDASNPFITIAGSGAGGAAVSGAVDTLVFNSSSKALINKNKENGIIAGDKLALNATGDTEMYIAGGGGAAAGGTSVGATISTIVVNKDIQAVADSTKLQAKTIDIDAKAVDNVSNVMVAGSFAGSVAVAGAINTTVVSTGVHSGIKNSVVNADNTTVNTNAAANYLNVTGGAAGAGVAGVGASVATNVIGYNASAYIDNTSLHANDGINSAKSVSVGANAASYYDLYTISGAGAGAAAVAGVVLTDVVNNTVKAYVTGKDEGINSAILGVNATDTVTFGGVAGTLAGGGVAGVGATIQTNSVTSTILSYIGGTIYSSDIDVTAKGVQDFNNLVALGFAGGRVGVSGSSLANIVEATAKAYIADNANIISTKESNSNNTGTTSNNDLNVSAENTTTITESVGSGSVGIYAAAGATVAVNQISNTVEAYTGDNVKINVKDAAFKATSTNNLGTSEKDITLIAGSASAGGALAGAVLVNTVEDNVKAYIGQNNKVTVDNSLDLNASANTNIYETVGGYAGAGVAAVGASVGVNTIYNTAIASIGSGSEITMPEGNLNVNASTNEKIIAKVNVVSGGGIALNGGILYNTIGQEVDNAKPNELSGDDAETYNTAKSQADAVIAEANANKNQADENFKTYYNNASKDTENAINDANNNINNSLSDGLNASVDPNAGANSDTDGIVANANANVSADNIEQKDSVFSLFTTSNEAGSSTGTTDRDGTTSAFVDTGAKILANDISINAANTNDVNLTVSGVAAGIASVGVAAGISEVNTTVNSFISNNVVMESNGKIDIKSNSVDNQKVNVSAASGGVGSGSGAIAKINSNKTTNSYILNSSLLSAINDLLINAASTGNISSIVSAGSYGGISVGVSDADAVSSGRTRVDIGENVTLNSDNENVKVSTSATEKSSADGKAAIGSLIGGSGADVNAVAGKDTTINIGKNVNITAGKAVEITSAGNNTVNAISDGRAYGGVAAGVTKTNANINHTGGVKIADSDEANKQLSAKSITITSTAANNVQSETNAGAGGIAGANISDANTRIISNNEVSVGKNYNVTTSDGGYIVAASSTNKYSGYNDSSAYGVVGVTAGQISNVVNSTVKAISNANVTANGQIEVFANNTITKQASTNYDLYGGAGGIVGVGAAVLKDDIDAITYAALGGDKAESTGSYNKGYINVSSRTDIDINEKVDVTAGGAIPAADGTVVVDTNISTKTEISNKDIKTKDDDIYYLADSDINIYTKANIESYGGVAIAEGESKALNTKAQTDVLIKSGTNTVSGRDTYIQAAANKDIAAYIYASTKGLIGVVGGSKSTIKNDSITNAIIEAGSNVKSYDSMNIIAQDTNDNFTAKRDAKGTTYLLFGIPIVIRGDDNSVRDNKNTATITLNGDVESGLGANKSLVINKDNTYTSDGVNVLGEKLVGTVTTAGIDADIQLNNERRDEAVKEVETKINTSQAEIKEIEKEIKEAQDNKIAKENENKTYNTAKINVNTIIDNNEIVNSITSVLAVWDSAYNDESSSVADSFGTALAKQDLDTFDSVKTMWNRYSNNPTALNLNNLVSAVNALSTEKAELLSTNNTLADNVKISTGLILNNTNLDAALDHIEDRIAQNNTSITNSETIIENNTNEITAINELIDGWNAEIDNIKAIYAEANAPLLAQKEAASKDGQLNIYSLYIDDIYVRSGETNITGNLTGSGTITAPGDKFTIEIINNSVNDVVYGDLSIDRNISGNINAGSIPAAIKTILKHQGPAEYTISIENTIDANDPTINYSNGYGDIVLEGNLNNVNGDIIIRNYTGNILTNGSITARNLQISVPNGNYAQNYSNLVTNIGGTDDKGAIIAGGDIDIEAKTINLNGLLQSGSEIQAVTIPDFTVVKEVDKDNNVKYYQVVNGVKTELKPGATEGYYYLELAGNGQLDSDLELIKAYFKPTDSTNANNVLGEIHLFKAEIQGGNITLTGNIVNDSNTGKIVLINGYGHIDITNNSNFNLITSALNADADINGKLTINDFKLENGGDETFDNLTHKDLTEEYLSEHAGKYEVYVDDNGNIVKSQSGLTDGNGSWGDTSSATRADGANIDTIIYTPGDDAYVVVQEGRVEEKYYEVYVKRSWWTELWHGKLYQKVYYTVVHEPVYGTAQNPITVQFQGFDKPEINVVSNGSVIMDNSINALTGTVNITSNNGSITTNSINNIISANNISLNAANGDVGNDIRAIQTAVYNNGTLNAAANNVYINYPTSEISNIVINATKNAYLATAGTTLGGKNAKIDIKANTLSLNARNGEIYLDSETNPNISIDVKEIEAQASSDIKITNNGDLNISSIVSTNKGTVQLGSQTGSINAIGGESYGEYHINAGNVILSAVNGAIGTTDAPIKVANDGIYYVKANNDINISSSGRIYANLISSNTGAVNLDSNFGIIASDSTDNLVYNIYSATGVNLNTRYGNIENIAINTDGVINATAGYSSAGDLSGLSDISISLISKPELTEETLANMSEAEQEVAYGNYTNGLKDMKLGTIKAANNVIIYSEGAILNDNETSSISGEKIILSAGDGDIGTEELAVNLTANRDITAFAGSGHSVYLETTDADKGLHINEIRASYNPDIVEGAVNSTLKNVVIKSAGDIINASENADAVNIAASNITLATDKNIGSSVKYFNVETTSSGDESGLTINAANAYINGIGDTLNIADTNISETLVVATGSGTDTIINDAAVGGSLEIYSDDSVKITNADVEGEIIVNKIKNEDAPINITADITIENADVEGNISINSANAVIEKAEIGGSANITTAKNTTIGSGADSVIVTGDTNIDSATTNIVNAALNGNANITTTG